MKIYWKNLPLHYYGWIMLLFMKFELHWAEQERKKEGERGGDFEEGSWGDQGADREVGNDE